MNNNMDNNMDKKLDKKTILRIKIGFISIVVLFLVVGIGNILAMLKEPGSGYGQTQIGNIYTLEDAKVYAYMGSCGRYLVEQADPVSFRLLEDSYENQHFAVDKNYAYVGNQVIKDFNVKTGYALGNNYYSDGNNTYYVSNRSVINDSLNTLQRLGQNILYGFGLMQRPQLSYHPVIKLPKGQQPYKSLQMPYTASNSEFTYYMGELMPGAIKDSLKPITELNRNMAASSSNLYSTDKNSLYYKNVKLDYPYSDELVVLTSDSPRSVDYLFDPLNGMIFIGDEPLDKQYAPYSLLSQSREHARHDLVLSQNGIFYYEPQSKEIKHIKENPFSSGEFKEIAPNIFYDSNEILFTQNKEYWLKGSKRQGLRKAETIVYLLQEGSNGNWRKVGDTHYQSGSVWENQGDFYFFIKGGLSNWSSDQSIYKIANPSVVPFILDDPLLASNYLDLSQNSGNIERPSYRDFIEILKEYLTAVKKKELVKATSDFTAFGL